MTTLVPQPSEDVALPPTRKSHGSGGRLVGPLPLKISQDDLPTLHAMQSESPSGSEKRKSLIVAWRARESTDKFSPQAIIKETEAENLRQKNAELVEEIERLRSHAQSLQNEGLTLRSQFSVVETSKSVTNKVLQDLTKEVLGLRTTKNDIEEAYHESLAREESLTQEVLQTKEKMSAILQQVEKLTIENQCFLRKETDLQNAVDMLQEKLQLSEQANASRCRDLEETCANLRRSLEISEAEKEDELSRLSLKLKEKTEKVEDLEAECTAHEDINADGQSRK
eukprot:jgi/Botrbrau1/23208/Bobra.0041s0052.1